MAQSRCGRFFGRAAPVKVKIAGAVRVHFQVQSNAANTTEFSLLCFRHTCTTPNVANFVNALNW
jgi:hypothetical protein